MNAKKEIYKSDIYADFLEEKKNFNLKYKKYANNITEYSIETKKLYKKILLSLEFDEFEKTELIMNDYKKQLMKLLKLHNDMVEEVIYSRYFLLLSKVEEKQKANIEKRRLTNKIHKAITAHKEQLKYINNLLK